ncbi:MAG TPA: YceI family protein [Polyangia bacterium]|jgi:polyisoprenoid-binding protein YceI|nr:YceI family protein [Polyangia bacterium]
MSNPLRNSIALKSTVAGALLGTLLLAPSARASEWELDAAHSTAAFAVRHLMVSTVKGEFEKVSGTVHLDDADPTKSTIEVTIDATTVSTRNAQRDGHLKSPDFFDVAKHPNLTFKSTKIEKAGKDKFNVVGDLTIRGTTHPVTLQVTGPTAPIKDMMGRTVRGVAATGKLNRKDWGLVWNKAIEGGGVLVSDEVQLEINAELLEKAATAKPASK